ncbi:HAD family hydrolase [Alicyclobacillus tolerans]|uniref:HAD family hydrolase n=1 Tax=Alicyclobacillus tolerans TaxID=90970 RepID=UPI001F1E1017|nr:HAD family hydrolase [Alicyclobacillus tolerans]MCF8564217.1 HAD family hydrolase [Alicyclobacillus tolerans]
MARTEPQHMGQTEITECFALVDCKVFVFDLDGTVYEETEHFPYYGRQLAKRLPGPVADEYLREVGEALAGRRTLTYGVRYDVLQDLVYKGDEVLGWTGDVRTGEASHQVANIDDPWGIYAVTAIHFGLSPAQVQEAFLATRDYMQGPSFPMRGLPGLRQALDGLKRDGVRFVLMTNSPEPDSRAIVEKLGLTGAFDIEVFEALKPRRVKEHFERYRDAFEVEYSEMVSIGDHYANEIGPAAELGMKTIHIDRYHRLRRSGVTIHLKEPAQLAGCLAEVLRARSTRAL